jgi:hypothetical protein
MSSHSLASSSSSGGSGGAGDWGYIWYVILDLHLPGLSLDTDKIFNCFEQFLSL